MTIERTASFTVRPEGLDRALESIGRFVAHTEGEPGTLLYVSWRSETRPYEFVHFMSFVDAEAEQTHASSDAVHAFTEALYPVCVEPPTFEGWHAVRQRGSRGGP
jgi:quinol monooxygenase YgiN